jgi:tRNA pseudouridine32 synthase / 23S rRNA pseudouridine746 synthase
VVNKPEGMLSIPGRNSDAECLLTELSGIVSQKLYVVHRLDREVSGVLIFAKDKSVHKFLNDQFSNRQIHKTYLALVHGRIENNEGLIDMPIRQFGSGRMGIDMKTGKSCATNYRVNNRFENYTLVVANPVTGRRHQIRVHFYSIGHAIVGDRQYGDKNLQKQFPHLMLHANKIAFGTPSIPNLEIEAPVPGFFNSALKNLATFRIDQNSESRSQ